LPIESAPKNLAVGSLVAPVWPPTGGGSAMGTSAERQQFVTQVRKACEIGRTLREVGIRRSGVIRIDSAASPSEWAKDPQANTTKIADTFREACSVAEAFGERLAAEGEICWGGMHSWKRNVELLEIVDRPGTLGFQADMAHTLLFTLGYNAPEDRILPDGFDWKSAEALDSALKTMTRALRPWTIDFHVAQNDATVRVRDRTIRPGVTVFPTIQTASSTSPATQDSGCATKADSRPAPLRISAGTAACFRTRP
jgi:hypothetical protein